MWATNKIVKSIEFVLCLIVLFFVASPVDAFISEEAGIELERLIDTTVSKGACPDLSRLSQLIAYCSLSSIDQAHRDRVAGHIGLFYSAISLAQQPPNDPDFFIHSFFIEYSNDTHRQSMIESLRIWLSDPGDKVQSGGLVSAGSISTIVQSVKAAEFLADLGDSDLPRLVAQFEEGHVLSKEEAWWLNRAAKRATNPCEVSFIREVSGRVEFCSELADTQVVLLQPGNHTHTETDAYVLSEDEKHTLLELVNGAVIDHSYRFGGEPYWFVVKFSDGLEVSFQPSHGGGGVLYFDNGYSFHKPGLALRKEGLFEWAYDLIQAQK